MKIAAINLRIGRRLAPFVIICLLFLGSVLPASANDDVHVVKPGETLSQIAESYGTTVEELRALNNLGNVDFVWYGQRLIVQAAGTAPLPRQSEITPAIAYYQVQPGDTLSEIADFYGIGLAHLVELNQISPAQRLYIGQTLAVPAKDVETSRRVAAINNWPVHVVQAGEHVGTIAALYGISVDALVQGNALANPSLIVPGQRLGIPPVGAVDSAAASTETKKSLYHQHTTFPTDTERWIDVDLSEQRVVAYEGTTEVRAFIISSGLPDTPTVTGTFRIWAKIAAQDMYGGNRASGDYYYLPGVPWVQYFYEDYAFHGTTWHANFGRPASHGCINMSPEEAAWLFEWAGPVADGTSWSTSDADNVGTLVVVHQ